MGFRTTRLAIPDVVLIETDRIEDFRGYFAETFRQSLFEDLGIHTAFIQDNQAMSVRPGTIRGLHFQKPPHAQAKLVRALKGALFDVVVDLRKDSETFGQWVGATLTAAGGEQLFVPPTFAHGYCTLEPETEIGYKCDAYYAPDHEGGIHFTDPDIGVDWPVDPEKAFVSDRDMRHPRFRDFDSPFTLGAPA